MRSSRRICDGCAVSVTSERPMFDRLLARYLRACRMDWRAALRAWKSNRAWSDEFLWSLPLREPYPLNASLGELPCVKESDEFIHSG